MRRRNLIITSDSDDDDDATATASASASASASVSVASVSGGGGGGGNPSPRNPSILYPYTFPSSPPPSPPIEISDDEVEDEEFTEIEDPNDGDFPFVDAPDDLSPPPPPQPPPPPRTLTPTPTPTSAPPPVRTPTPTSTPACASAPPPVRISTPNSAPAWGSAPPPIRTPTPTPPSNAQAPTPASAPFPARAATTPSPIAPSTTPPSAVSGPLRPVDEFLRGLGLRLRTEWLESCAAGVPGFYGLGSAEAKARRCFEQFLFSDMNACGAGVLPEGVGSMQSAVLDGPFVLQVDEVVNISAPLRERYRDAHAGPKRCLKLSMTDGIQRIYGIEYRPIKDLEVLAPAGFKIVIRNVHIRRGLFMLVAEVLEILGGVVDEIEEARHRLVSEVNKPPRGKRKQGGLPLSSRATLAAWPSNTNVTNHAEQGTSMPRTVNTPHPTELGNAHASQVGRTTQVLVDEHSTPHVVSSNAQEQARHAQEITMQDQSTSRHNTETPTSISYRYDQQCSISGTTRATVDGYVDPSGVANNVHEQIPCVQDITMQDHAIAFTGNKRESAPTPPRYDSQHGPHGAGHIGPNDVDAARSLNVDDGINHIGHPISLSGENEKPFTYIFNMLAEWGVQQDTTPYIQGKIMGLITSVKRFQYKQFMRYDLYLYIDDGSFITEAFLDRDIVQNMIGYTAEEVAAGLSSGGPAQATIKTAMKGFEDFLMNFEGTMLIEFNRKSSVPIVREMNKGISSSDVWLLLRRVKTFSRQGYMRRLCRSDNSNAHYKSGQASQSGSSTRLLGSSTAI
uniref:RecQ-mediated genome instability protein 1 n=1 Tax=Leersia perrieri TaxID=77586 RepID=A0A0D9W4A3_9ORYZ